MVCLIGDGEFIFNVKCRMLTCKRGFMLQTSNFTKSTFLLCLKLYFSQYLLVQTLITEASVLLSHTVLVSFEYFPTISFCRSCCCCLVQSESGFIGCLLCSLTIDFSSLISSHFLSLATCWLSSCSSFRFICQVYSNH